ncbi:hypothetical protein ACJO2E_02595 [Marinobacter sp. M1N3S26]|uniref:hypothetical protein n=1 Tax=Marinobacter sp. M1N3S26 TaxID=3382299 RepID=UPI00387B7B67
MNTSASPFPELPAYQADGMAIFMEPVAGSGERLCVAVAAQGVDRAFEVVTVVRDSTAKCMLGEAGPKFMDMIGLVVDSLQGHLKSGNPLSAWAPPMSGVTSGPVQAGRVADLTVMLRTMARNSAFLARMSDFAADAEEFETPAPDRWITQVKDVMAIRHPKLVRNFTRKLQLYTGGAPTNFDYVGTSYVAQLSRIIPGNGLSTYNRIAKAKMWELISLRDKGHTGLFQLDDFELILYRPQKSDPSFSESEIARVYEVFHELEEEADKQELRVHGVSSPESAVDCILKGEAA